MKKTQKKSPDSENKSLNKNEIYNENNIFARILRNEIPCRKVYENEHVLAFHDINPQAPIHVLVISKSKYLHFMDLLRRAPAKEIYSYFDGIAKTASVLGFKKTEFRLLFDGKDVPHIHAHILSEGTLGALYT